MVYGDCEEGDCINPLRWSVVTVKEMQEIPFGGVATRKNTLCEGDQRKKLFISTLNLYHLFTY